MHTYGRRLARLVCGLFIGSLGGYLTIRASIGLAPWDAFTIGVAQQIHRSYGFAAITTGLLILLVDWKLDEKIGLGTLVNTILIGLFIDGIDSLGVIPEMETFAGGLAMLFAGQLLICVSAFFYMGAGLGCGPRDAVMVALCKRLPRTPVGLVRGALEGTVLLTGWLLGAKVGIGTVISVFGIGFLMQAVFHVLSFDVKGVRHEGLGQTLAQMGVLHPRPRGGAAESAPAPVAVRASVRR